MTDNINFRRKNEVGMLSLIQPKTIVDAAKLVKSGRLYSLALPIRAKGVPQFPTRRAPFHSASTYQMGNATIAEDYISTSTHNQTHIDALAHVWKGSKLFNGFSSNNVTTRGAKRCSIDKAGPIVTRGVLLDIARYKKLDNLERGYAINDQDLFGCMREENIKISPGDALLIRTGWIRTFDPKEPVNFFRGDPGLAIKALKVIDKSRVSVIGSDNYSLEVDPSESGTAKIPLHLELIWKRGIHLIELMNLEELSKDKVWEFLLVITPLPISNGLGSPVAPVAIS